LLLAAEGTHASRQLFQQQQQQTTALPVPDFYFPLTGENLASSIPAGKYSAVSSPGLSWTADPMFGTVVACNDSLGDFLALPGVSFGQNGPFTVALWVKPNPVNGTGLDYAFSHASTSFPNGSQVHMYTPEKAHVDSNGISDAGEFRTIAKDDTDPPESSAGPTFLDSNGCVSAPGCNTSSPARPPLDDDRWHFLTLSTHPGGGKGVDFYVDGTLAGSMVEGISYANGGIIATGGENMTLNGTLHLCSRVDENVDRFYSGSLAQLRIYNTAFDAPQVKALYQSDQAAALSRSMSPPSTSDQMSPPPVTSGGDGSVATLNGQPACSSRPVQGIGTVSSCGQGYTCASLSSQQLNATLGPATAAAAQGVIGVCVFAPQGILLPPADEVPAAM